MAKKTPATAGKEKAKTVCPVSRAEFLKNAKPVELTINGQTLYADPKEFSTGSFGWHANGKITFKVGDTPVTAQMGLLFTAVGSKETE